MSHVRIRVGYCIERVFALAVTFQRYSVSTIVNEPLASKRACLWRFEEDWKLIVGNYVLVLWIVNGVYFYYLPCESHLFFGLFSSKSQAPAVKLVISLRLH